MRKICVFCGSRSGHNPTFTQAAIDFGTTLAKQGKTLIYGGEQPGLMGTLANAMLEHGGEVIGIIPRVLVESGAAHPSLTELHVVDSLHERKQRMFQKADGFVALPGGTGTLDELSEIICLRQIGAHEKPIGLLDVADFFQPWLQLFDHMIVQGFVQPAVREWLPASSMPTTLLSLMQRRL